MNKNLAINYRTPTYILVVRHPIARGAAIDAETCSLATCVGFVVGGFRSAAGLGLVMRVHFNASLLTASFTPLLARGRPWTGVQQRVGEGAMYWYTSAAFCPALQGGALCRNMYSRVEICSGKFWHKVFALMSLVLGTQR